MGEIRSIVAAVTARALEHRVVRRICVTRSAHTIGIAMAHREERVITRGQSRRKPCSGRVARGACSGPARRYVVGIRRCGKVRLVARVAGCRCPGVDVVYVALDAVDSHMRAGQWERRVVVIKGRSCPCSCAVTGVACGWESRCSMPRISRAVPIRLVAAVAGGR